MGTQLPPAPRAYQRDLFPITIARKSSDWTTEEVDRLVFKLRPQMITVDPKDKTRLCIVGNISAILIARTAKISAKLFTTELIAPKISNTT